MFRGIEPKASGWRREREREGSEGKKRGRKSLWLLVRGEDRHAEERRDGRKGRRGAEEYRGQRGREREVAEAEGAAIEKRGRAVE